jgi:ubiquinone/menaquinone biosynthesis C-methylase UbiE
MQSHQSNDKVEGRRGGALARVIESKKIRRQNYSDYRRFIQHHYDGFAGRLTGLTGMMTGHATLAGRLFSPRAFDVSHSLNILDAACGDGRYTRLLLKRADPKAFITCFDLSQRMLKRARRRLPNKRVSHVAADITRLPYPDAHFDAIVCGWVLEHLPDPRVGLRELARVLQRGGKMLLMVTEDTLTGSVCSRMWHCRTYNRSELARVCQECGLRWARPLWFSRLHKLFRLGGIIVELHRD